MMLRWSPLLFVLLLCGGCCDLCNAGRRPEVIVEQASSVIDYNAPCYDEFRPDPCPGVKTRDVTPQDLNPTADGNLNYYFQVGDALEISLFGEDESSVEQLIVADDGKIYYGFAEGIQAEGKTPVELANAIENKFKRLYVNPVVTLTPLHLTGQTYCALGRVHRPGLYDLPIAVTLRDAIAHAGGLVTDELSYQDADKTRRTTADLTRSFIVRGDTRLNVDFERLLLNGDNRQNVYIRPGDYIYVAPEQNEEVYVLGSVIAPQKLPYIRGLTLMGAMASVGGWEPNGPYGPNLQKFLIIRGSLECPRVLQVDISKILCGQARDVYLCPGDILYAQHKTMRFGRELLNIAINSFFYCFAEQAGFHFGAQHVFDLDFKSTKKRRHEKR